jgi:hypothetical protein
MMSTRRRFMQLAAMAGIALSVAPISGCSQEALADLIGIAGVSVAQLLNALGQGNSALAAQLASLFAAARTAVATWVKGSATQNVIQALNDVLTVIAQLPVNSATSVLIGIAIAAIEHVIQAIDPGAAPVAASHIARVSAANVHWSHVARTPKEVYKSAWNRELANHPELAAAKLN